MKKYKRYLFICIAICSIFLSGCGTELYELTAEEEELIVHSAAYLIAKHNIQQKDGVSAEVHIDDVVDEQPELEELEKEEPETELAEEVVDGGNAVAEDETEAGDASVSLAEVIGHATDLTVSYGGSYLAENYVEGNAYSVDASAGKTFYVMKFTITNVTEQEVLLDNASSSPIFKLVSGDVKVKSEVTFLTTDFSTYIGTIPAGESVETILLFEVPKDSGETILEPTLQITIDNQTKNVKL